MAAFNNRLPRDGGVWSPEAATPANILAAAISASFRFPQAAGEGSGNFPRLVAASCSGATIFMEKALLGLVVGLEAVNLSAAGDAIENELVAYAGSVWDVGEKVENPCGAGNRFVL
jgi:hypothetical protein